MTKPIGSSLRVVVACSVVATLALTNEARADPTIYLPGVACEFALQVDSIGGNSNTKVFRNGNIIVAGTGGALTFTNIATGKTLSLASNGSTEQLRFNADGTPTVTLTGHTVLILFPTDRPPGPTTTLYVGRVVFTIDDGGNFTVLSNSGQSTDICAALS
jgi:hypothetical protein